MKFAGPIHWNCVRSKQVVVKCSDVATFHQNLAMGKRAKLVMEAQGASSEQVYTRRDKDGSRFAYCQCFIITVILLVSIFYFIVLKERR